MFARGDQAGEQRTCKWKRNKGGVECESRTAGGGGVRILEKKILTWVLERASIFAGID